MTEPAGIRDHDVSIDELREAVEHMQGVPARFVEAVEVDDRFKARSCCRGGPFRRSRRSRPASLSGAFALAAAELHDDGVKPWLEECSRRLRAYWAHPKRSPPSFGACMQTQISGQANGSAPIQ
jgi:hypothetical protein